MANPRLQSSLRGIRCVEKREEEKQSKKRKGEKVGGTVFMITPEEEEEEAISRKVGGGGREEGGMPKKKVSPLLFLPCHCLETRKEGKRERVGWSEGIFKAVERRRRKRETEVGGGERVSNRGT